MECGYMVCVSNDKATSVKCTCFILVVLVFAFISYGCDPYYNNYPYDNASSWICENPPISLTYKTESSELISQKETILWNGSTLEIDVLFQSEFYTAYPANSSIHDERLFSGSWYYRDNNLVLSVEEDFIFDYQFDELVFVPLGQ